MLSFLKKFGIFCFLDNNNYDFDKSYECVAGAGVITSVVAGRESEFKDIDGFCEEACDWIFAHVSYDIKNNFEDLQSSHFDGIEFPDYLFFIPEIVFIVSGNELKIGTINPYKSEEIYNEIISYTPAVIKTKSNKTATLKSRFTKEEYVESVTNIQRHILKGNCYELNFCQEFYATDFEIDPSDVFLKLSEISPSPFAAFYKYNEKYLLCASPERFLKKSGNTIFSQPIKGTAKRNMTDRIDDEQQKENLITSPKERSENIMIVDLVRNDLSKICEEGSVFVKSFLQVYSFPHVHQMISTISGRISKNISISEIFLATFPMGSMTGAPKKRVMELIENYERTKRGLFSGTIGYINPAGDFDFNVVIRSILYNRSTKYLSMQSGSAITFKSNPENEFEECLMKISAMKKTLE
ncbi:MAG: anthranilate synthase component I family protein [Ginsengibacter sp.]